MIALVDYRMGNIRSVENALSRLGAEYTLTSDPALIASAKKVILPGVGNAARAMANLREEGLIDVIRSRRKPVLGICIGMQVLCRYSEEGDTPCMGLFDTDVRRFDSPAVLGKGSGIDAGALKAAAGTSGAACGLKIPHMGWNRISNLDSKLFKNIDEGSFVYFVHSYRPGICTDTIATTDYGGIFSAALKYENFYGTQFHPEKSGDVGERILENFLKL